MIKILIIAVLAILVSCTREVNLHKTKTAEDLSTRTADSVRISQLEREASEYKRRLDELSYLDVTFTEAIDTTIVACCDSAIAWKSRSVYVDTNSILTKWKDALGKSKERVESMSKIVMSKDGELTIASANIKSITLSKKKIEQEMASVKKENAILKDKISLIESKSTKVVEVKDKKVKAGFMSSMWIWLLIGAICGWVAKSKAWPYISRFASGGFSASGK